jgi:hypothetical protein
MNRKNALAAVYEDRFLLDRRLFIIFIMICLPFWPKSGSVAKKILSKDGALQKLEVV